MQMYIYIYILDEYAHKMNWSFENVSYTYCLTAHYRILPSNGILSLRIRVRLCICIFYWWYFNFYKSKIATKRMRLWIRFHLSQTHTTHPHELYFSFQLMKKKKKIENNKNLGIYKTEWEHSSFKKSVSNHWTLTKFVKWLANHGWPLAEMICTFRMSWRRRNDKKSRIFFQPFFSGKFPFLIKYKWKKYKF